MKLFVLVIPALPSDAKFYYKDNCSTVQWEKQDTGNCSVVYHLKFSNSDIAMSAETFYRNCSIMNATSVSIWGVYNGHIGDKSYATLQQITTPSITKEKACKFAHILCLFFNKIRFLF